MKEAVALCQFKKMDMRDWQILFWLIRLRLYIGHLGLLLLDKLARALSSWRKDLLNLETKMKKGELIFC